MLIRNRASGLCHTDLEVIEGSLAYPLPIVLGHEGAGIVEAVGAAVTLVRPGDHVVASWNPHCGHCFYCERDLPILCEPFTREQPRGNLLDGASRLRCERRPAEPLLGRLVACRVLGRARVGRDQGARRDAVRSRLPASAAA